jgi:hypothetical protein
MRAANWTVGKSANVAHLADLVHMSRSEIVAVLSGSWARTSASKASGSTPWIAAAQQQVSLKLAWRIHVREAGRSRYLCRVSKNVRTLRGKFVVIVLPGRCPSGAVGSCDVRVACHASPCERLSSCF